ncbi:MAG: TnpV protein, partial [Clostridia bacterium]|nr:TnpV protein [Clostridia bacterium]
MKCASRVKFACGTISGTLEGYLREVNREATEMLETLVRQYATAEGVTESLKRTDQLG